MQSLIQIISIIHDVGVRGGSCATKMQQELPECQELFNSLELWMRAQTNHQNFVTSRPHIPHTFLLENPTVNTPLHTTDRTMTGDSHVAFLVKWC